MISDRPLIRGTNLTITEPGDYQTLLEVACDPGFELYIRDIMVLIDDVGTPKPFVNLNLNGQPYLKDHLCEDGLYLSFGGNLKVWQPDKPIKIQIKTTAVGTLYATGYVIGLEVPVKLARK